MATDKKKYNREYYAAHREIWQKNYAENANARRASARTYANTRWENDPEYRAAHSESTIKRTRRNRRIRSLAAITEKIHAVLQKTSREI